MKLVVLDGHAANPGDLSWSALEQLAQVRVYPRSAPHQIVERCRDAAWVLTNKTVLNGAMLQALPGLRYVGVLATGYNVVDLEAARTMGIAVTNVPAYSTTSVAQHTMALLLELTQHAGLHSAGVAQGRWANNADFSYWDRPLVELAGLTIGIVGYGEIGRAVARLALAFGMHVLAHRRPRAMADDISTEFVPLEELLRRSDVVSLHCPLTPENHEMINSSTLSLMKPNAFFINTSRGPLVREADLALALVNGTIAGAALDVLCQEPPRSGTPLLNAPNCIITPHIAWATRSARARLLNTAAANLSAFVAGRRQNRVD